jgi:hypothetical protein
MPTEYYVGIAIGIIVIVLLGLLLKPRRGTRPVIQQKSIETDQLAKQLSRIADSLEILVAHLGASPPAEKPSAANSPVVNPPVVKAQIEKPPTEEPSVPLQNAPEPSGPDEVKTDQPPERHVRLSMFGR